MRSDTVGRPMEILLVEDSISAARLTMGVLRNSDLQHRMTWVTNGDDAMEFVRQQGKYAQAPRPDLILLDLTLPKKDGREVLKELKSEKEFARIPVLILTSSTEEEDIAQTEQLHVESYLTKPIDIERFLSVIKELNRFWHADMILPTSD